METEIPEELKEKLKVAKMETEFFLQPPLRKPRVLLYVPWGVIGVAAAVATVLTFKSGDGFKSTGFALWLFQLAIALFGVVTYFYERRLCRVDMITSIF